MTYSPSPDDTIGGDAPESCFLSCDWGTTSFRLRLVQTNNLQILAELKNHEGITATFQSWLSAQKPASERLAFYRDTLQAQITALQTSLNDTNVSALPPIKPLSGIPLIISGMASSSIGMQELPYKSLPFNTNGEDLQVAIFEATASYPHPILLLSGVRSTDDVMRGEETQLIGCFPLRSGKQASLGGGQGDGESQGRQESIFIFPGTHSKHVRVRDNQVVGLRTYMTGEYFHLLTKHSILAGSIAESAGLTLTPNAQPVENGRQLPPTPFQQGVLDSIDANLLHQSFQVRTHQVLGQMSKEDNYHYLSGLLIGSECRDLLGTCLPITVVSDGTLQQQYAQALQTLVITGVQLQDLNQAVIRAHARLCKSFLGK